MNQIIEVSKDLVGEIAVRYKPKTVPATSITQSCEAVEFLRPLFENIISYRERFYVLLLNRANKVLGWVHIGEGGISGVLVDIKIIFQHALLANASSMILAHNHPSGNLKPSKEDITITRKIQQAGKIMEITVLDHVIVTWEGYYSFADEGAM